MKKTVLLIVAFVLSLPVFAQQWKELDSVKASHTAASIMSSVRGVNQMNRSFKQVKTSPIMAKPSVSTGKMRYVSPSRLTWEYESPTALTVEIDGDNMTVLRDGKQQKLSPKHQTGLKSMMKVIVGMSNGSSLFDDRNFEWKLFENNGSYKVEMIPKNKNIKRMFVRVNLFFDKGTKTVTGLDLSENDDTVTTITFSK